ncbi:hypothetical protein FRC11_007209, partial [Ceratobasidium sp. 423]
MQVAPVPEVPPEMTQLEATMNEIKDLLGNVNRMLTLIKRDQSTVGCTSKYYHLYKNPLNKEGVAAS